MCLINKNHACYNIMHYLALFFATSKRHALVSFLVSSNSEKVVWHCTKLHEGLFGGQENTFKRIKSKFFDKSIGCPVSSDFFQ